MSINISELKNNYKQNKRSNNKTPEKLNVSYRSNKSKNDNENEIFKENYA